MTMRERFTASQRAIERGKYLGRESTKMFSIGQDAIRDTTELLKEMARYISEPKGKVE